MTQLSLSLSLFLLVRILESVAIRVAVRRISIGDYGNRRETLTFERSLVDAGRPLVGNRDRSVMAIDTAKGRLRDTSDECPLILSLPMARTISHICT